MRRAGGLLMRLIAYSRVSTEDQARGGHSLSQQPERLAAGCIAHQHTLVDVIVEGEGVSGSIPLERRPGGAALLRRLKARDADGVIVVRLERLFRDLLDGVHFFRTTARDHGIAVVSLSEHIDTSCASGRMALNMHLLMADYERDKGAERTAEVMRGLREGGRVYGHVPYGCAAVDGALYRDAGTWPLRESIVRLRTVDAMTYDAMRHVLRERGVPAPNGGQRWAKSSLAEIVKTHSSLTHLPLQPMQVAPAACPAPEAAASERSDTDAHAAMH